ncbi:6-carboxytetrahydropterin synthase [Pseudonocardia sp. CA-107938]|uniref:6-carboxytetrahydropterin synthase n=1 Tax=Pseudonocardia sp. CA-107938 TaxID=3240021 RepID=UPI003D8CA495
MPYSPAHPYLPIIYSDTVAVTFPAVHHLGQQNTGQPDGTFAPNSRGRQGIGRCSELDRRSHRPHGHDFHVAFTFHATGLLHPGVVVDADMRAEILDHLDSRYAYQDLNLLLPATEQPTCANIAAHLARWHYRSARITPHAYLHTVVVTTGSGDRGQIVNPPPPQLASADQQPHPWTSP